MTPAQWFGMAVAGAGIALALVITLRTQKDGVNRTTAYLCGFIILLGAAIFFGGDRVNTALEKAIDHIPSSESSP